MVEDSSAMGPLLSCAINSLVRKQKSGKSKTVLAESTPETKTEEKPEVRNEQYLDGLVIAVAGTVDNAVPYTHARIEEMIHPLGARFESGELLQCTHLITTQKMINRRSKKVLQALKIDDCELVTLHWLLACIEKKKWVDPTNFRLSVSLIRKSISKKKSDESTDESITGKFPSPKKSKRKQEDDQNDKVVSIKRNKDMEPNDPFLAALVDERFEKEGHFSVHIDKAGEVWDAILIGSTTSPASKKAVFQIYRLQVLYDHLMDRHEACFLETKTEGRVVRIKAVTKKKDYGMKAAQNRFKCYFRNETGLSWSCRDQTPLPDKLLYLQCSYDDIYTRFQTALHNKLKGEHMEALGVIWNGLMAYRAANQSATSRIMANISIGRPPSTSMHHIRMGLAILTKMNGIVENGVDKKLDKKQMKILGDIYKDILCQQSSSKTYGYTATQPEFTLSKCTNWITVERESLEFWKTLKLTEELLDESDYVLNSDRIHRLYRILGLESMVPLDPKGKEFNGIHDYFKGSINPQRHRSAKVRNIFKVRRPGEEERLEKWSSDPTKEVESHRRLLWHGSHSTNFLGLLSQGLRINATANPIAVLKSHNPGIFFADFAGKSINYCREQAAGMDALMLLCDVELGGKFDSEGQVKHKNDVYPLSKFVQGTYGHREWCKADEKIHPDLHELIMPNVEAGMVAENAGMGFGHNEYIIYDPAQVRIMYLVHFKML